MNRFMEEKRFRLENYVGGMLALIAIVAILIKTFSTTVTLGSMMDMVKDIAQLVVSALVMLVALRLMIRHSPRNLREEIQMSLARWEQLHRPLIFKVKDFEPTEKYQIRYSILAQQRDFLKLHHVMTTEEEAKYSTKDSKSSGKFVSFPSEENMISGPFQMEFHLISSSYQNSAQDFIHTIMHCITSRYPNLSVSKKTNQDFVVEYPKISTKEQVREWLSFIQFVQMLLVIQA